MERVGIASFLLLSAVLASASPVRADEPPDIAAGTVAREGYPFQAVSRPLTLPQAAIRLELEGGVFRRPDFVGGGAETASQLVFGAAIGITDGLELGISANRLGSYQWRYSTVAIGDTVPLPVLPQGAVALTMSPDTDFGDVPVYARARLIADERVAIGGDVGVVIPIDGDFELHVGLPVRFFVGPHATFDFGPQMRVAFRDDMAGGTLVTVAMGVRGLYQLFPAMYLSVQSGFEISDSGLDSFALPLWAELGFTVGRNEETPYLDLVVTGGWPAILVGTSDDRSIQQIWALTGGIRAYVQP